MEGEIIINTLGKPSISTEWKDGVLINGIRIENWNKIDLSIGINDNI